MLRLPAFAYLRPTTLDEATAMLRDEGTAEGAPLRLVAGGTDLWPNMKRRHQKASGVVSLMGIPELAHIEANGELHIGATSLLADVERHPEVRRRYPALATAVASISSPPLRNMGTLGGNLCVDTRCTYYNQTEDWRRSIDFCKKEEGEICWVAPGSPRCWAHAASDAAPMLCALKSRVRLVSADGERVVPLEALYRNDGIDYLTRRADEILAEVLVPPESDARRCRTAFWKLRRRGSIDFAVLSVAVALWIADDGTVEEARIFLGAVSSAPVHAEQAAQELTGKRLDADAIAAAAAAARKPATPLDMTDFTPQWRSAMVPRYTEAAVREAAGLDPGLTPPHHVRF
ncbi:MAG: FAD binding domain-containing protein [Thermoanaerobaculia bacterium]